MKRAARANRQVKPEIVTIDDDEPAAKQPIMKSVKMEVQSSEPSPTLVQELQEKLKKSEERCQRAIHIAGQHLARKEHLERLLEKKPNIVQDGRVEELEKKVRELMTELESERKRGDEETKRYTERVRDLTTELEAERKRGEEETKRYTEKVRDLTTELEAEKKRGDEEMKRYNERVADLTKQLDEERRRGISTRVIERENVSKYVDGEIKKVKEELAIERGRVRILTNELEMEKKRGIENRTKECQSIAPPKSVDGGIKKVKKELAIERSRNATLTEQLKKARTDVKTRGININVAHQTISQLRKDLAHTEEEHEKDRQRINELETTKSRLIYELACTRKEHVKDQKRITEYAAKLAMYEVGLKPPAPPVGLCPNLPQQQPVPQPAPTEPFSAPDKAPLVSLYPLLPAPQPAPTEPFSVPDRAPPVGVYPVLPSINVFPFLHPQQPTAKPAPTEPFSVPDRAPQVSLYLQQPTPQPAQAGPFSAMIATSPHSTNILELLSPNSKGCIPLGKALDLLLSGYDRCDAKIWHKFCLSDINSKFICAVCTSVHSKCDLLKHFFTHKHIEKVRASGAGVSEVAVKHWLFWMLQAAPAAAAGAAAAAPGPSSSGLPLSLSSPSPLILSSPSPLPLPSSGTVPSCGEVKIEKE